MVWLDIELNHLAPQLPTKHLNTVVYLMPNWHKCVINSQVACFTWEPHGNESCRLSGQGKPGPFAVLEPLEIGRPVSPQVNDRASLHNKARLGEHGSDQQFDECWHGSNG